MNQEMPHLTKSMGYSSNATDLAFEERMSHIRAVNAMSNINHPLLGQMTPTQQQEKQTMSNTRIARVIIADTNESLPLDKRILYMGEEKLTDLTDNELFFELPMADLLVEHNKVRTATKDKASKDGEMLPAARIRDLRMVVVDIAKF